MCDEADTAADHGSPYLPPEYRVYAVEYSHGRGYAGTRWFRLHADRWHRISELGREQAPEGARISGIDDQITFNSRSVDLDYAVDDMPRGLAAAIRARGQYRNHRRADVVPGLTKVTVPSNMGGVFTIRVTHTSDRGVWGRIDHKGTDWHDREWGGTWEQVHNWTISLPFW